MRFILLVYFLAATLPFMALGLQRKNFFNFRIILMVSLGIIYVLPLFSSTPPTWKNDDGFILTILVGLMGFTIAMIALSRFSPGAQGIFSYQPHIKQFPVRPRVLLLLSILNIGFILFNIFKTLPNYSPMDIVLFLLSDRVETYLNDPLSNSALFGFLKRFLSISTLIYVFYLWQQRNKLAFLLYGLILFELIITSHTRFVVLTTLLLPVLYFHFFQRRLGIQPLAVIGVISVTLLSLGNFVRGGYFADSRPLVVSEILAPEVVLNQVSRGSSFSTDYFYSIFILVQDGPQDIEYGEQYTKYLPLAPIPRFLWPGKPRVSYFHRATEMIEGLAPGETGQKIYTTTILGEAFHQFHLIGVFLTPFIYIFMIALLLRFMQNLQYSDIIFWLILLHVPMDIRGGLFSITITLISYIIILGAVFLLAYRKDHQIESSNTFVAYF